MTILGYWDFLGAAGLRIVCEAGAAAYVGSSIRIMAAGKSRINSNIVLAMFMAHPLLVISAQSTLPLKISHRQCNFGREKKPFHSTLDKRIPNEAYFFTLF
jgi:hypothetical protein